MKVLVTGATGFIGRRLCKALYEQGAQVVALSRNPSKARQEFPFPIQCEAWDGLKGPPDARALEGVEAVFHLMGEGVADQKWNQEVKNRILESRVKGTQLLVQGLKAAGAKPEFFLSASAIGFYGDRGEEELTESSKAGTGFLSEVAQAWEKEVQGSALTARKVCLRIGIVLGKDGGLMKKFVPLFKSGLGGPVGPGKQWMSWIHVQDVVSLMIFCWKNSSISGVVNAVSPQPVTNAEFSSELAKALHRPAFFRAPSFGLKVAMGEMSVLALSSCKVMPKVAVDSGFRFGFPSLAEALSDLCAPPKRGRFDKLVYEQWIPKKVDEIFPFFAEAKNLEVITPPWLEFNVLGASTPDMREGTLIDYKLKLHGVNVRWQSRIESWEPNKKFVDFQTRGPYSYWHHTHEFKPMGEGTLMIDRIEYGLPMGSLGRAVAGWKVDRDLEQIFSFRKQKIDELFAAKE